MLPGRFARRLALAFAALGVGSALLTAVLVNTAFAGRFQDYLDKQQHAQQEQLVALFAADYRRNDAWNPVSLNRIAPTVIMTGSEAELHDASGRRVWSVADANTDAGTPEMHRKMMAAGSLGPPRSLPVVVAGRPVGTLVVRVPQGSVSTVDKEFHSSVNRLLVAGALIAALVALLVGVYTARRATKPITELTSAAGALAAGHRDRRASTVPNNEIGQLAKAFNTMVEHLVKEDQLRRAFTADVAHELRTPLAILRSELEAVQDGIRQPTDGVIRSLHNETLRLTHLVADLEALASADAAAFTLERHPISLTSTVADTADSLAGRFDEAAIAVRTDLDMVWVDADPVRVAQIVANQLTNTLKFVPAGGAVTLTLHEIDGWAELTITDTGSGISADDLPHIFDRFYRSRTARADGSGIGLAVVAQLVKAHGGTITAHSTPGHGATFITRLPALRQNGTARTARADQRPTV
ncbi:HAMP domain-containing protein [Mycobacterium intracellulare]|uniref:histidine kinase n=1 Tax=Mycobacterium indicus pranii (strain DSM 45239 / MTCC 9506) TaxID=1232724 RepID=J9WCF0_MYCIP|nr:MULTISPECIES: ATP-binding protein [Mycobacterium avium complex (MAC)]ETZ37667.1 HAMP domain protein [Mycobacterium avium MAV_120809_2495]ETZ39198.1 HAMP domain protein [Mycobacterium intracellulare MIN_052511_1280]ETZ57336.1 HAMP domain protein [Mycobacterium avium MAV_120709_2344]KDP08305.1 histidine kinase [Mycobacterium avium subsp. hominissuis 100]AFS14884.1 Signal transduction histidine-protein kinase baeS [Mycobacterium intracellulare subsp. intracellulare MTCC 9506]